MAPRKKAAAAAATAAPAATPVPLPNGSASNATTAGTLPDATPFGKVANPLDGVRVAVSGHVNVSDYSPYSLNYLLGGLGAAEDNRVMNCTTHVIATREDYHKEATKVRNGLAKDLPVVRATWVTECDRTQTLVDAEKHHWPNIIKAEQELWEARGEYVEAQKNGNGTQANGSQTNGSQTNGTQTNGTDKKRPIAVANPNGADADAEDDVKGEDDAPKPKKARAARANKQQPKYEEEDEEMEDAEEPEGEEEDKEADNKVPDGQIKSKGAVIPVDQLCHMPGFQVYVDPDTGVIFDASLNQTNASHNNNKFYIIQLLHDPKADKYSTWTRWGRVGEPGSNATLGNGTLSSAMVSFEKKFKDKSGLTWEKRTDNPRAGKYAFVERSYEPDTDDEDGDGGDAKDQKSGDADPAVKEEEEPEPECTLDDATKNLVEMIFNTGFMQATLSELNYDANKLPLGKLSKSTILRGFEQLKSLAALFNDPALAVSHYNSSVGAATEHLSNTYYSLIPHDFGRSRPPIISDERVLKREVELLESLSDMKIAADLMKADRKAKDADPVHHLDRKFQSLNMDEMTPLKPTTKEFKTLEKYLCGTVGTTHSFNYKVLDIFRIERRGEHDRFDKSAFADIPSDKRLLWHGSRCTNFGGILSQGLRIAPPEAPVSGYMFGKGIYLADMSSKSAGYCCSSMSNGEGLLLLCEAELGDPMHELIHSSYQADQEAKSAGKWSTKGMGTTAPPKWMDAGAVHKSLKGVKMPDPSAPATTTNVQNASLFYNEYICYDVDQVKLRYLFRVKM